ncbi:hypothetical protein FSP39_022757 [Pinctada imbricata]|uniref:Uncharacterized protein n=1 Tax=Pinctada imbricata TaxID=66713 RepID=A0AA89C4F0_PINIB|nr:hypothetical protein FSP39_022757 [Pinctada imbricata]
MRLIPDVVVLHSLTNDIKSLDPDTFVGELTKTVDIISNKWCGSKIILSTCTPRFDSIQNQTNAQLVNALVKQKFSAGYANLSLCEHNNMSNNGNPAPDILTSDNYHLSSKGISVLASNIQVALHSALGIQVPAPRGRSPSRNRRGGGRGGRGQGRFR